MRSAQATIADIDHLDVMLVTARHATHSATLLRDGLAEGGASASVTFRDVAAGPATASLTVYDQRGTRIGEAKQITDLSAGLTTRLSMSVRLAPTYVYASPPPPPTLTLGTTQVVGISTGLTLTVRDHGNSGSVSVHVRSQAESVGETLVLAETAPSSGEFIGTVPLERLYDANGTLQALAGNGRLGVYAEGGVISDMLSATYGSLSATASYEEPSSTLTGVATAAGRPVSGAVLELSGMAGAWQTKSRSDGSYAFYDLPPGTYSLVTQAPGVAPRTLVVVIP